MNLTKEQSEILRRKFWMKKTKWYGEEKLTFYKFTLSWGKSALKGFARLWNSLSFTLNQSLKFNRSTKKNKNLLISQYRKLVLLNFIALENVKIIKINIADEYAKQKIFYEEDPWCIDQDFWDMWHSYVCCLAWKGEKERTTQ